MLVAINARRRAFEKGLDETVVGKLGGYTHNHKPEDRDDQQWQTDRSKLPMRPMQQIENQLEGRKGHKRFR
jgi:hypothetical protein